LSIPLKIAVIAFFELLLVGAIELSELFLDMFEEEEVAWSEVEALGRMRQSFVPCRPDTFLGLPGIVGGCLIQMEHEPFQRLSTATRSKVNNQTWQNDITQECRVISHPFGNVNETVDSVD
jgi:hypothetical protein